MKKLIAIALFAISSLFVLALPAAADGMVRTGEFSGLSKHKTSGTVTVSKTDEGYVITLEDNFKFDGAPDPKVALGKDGKFDPSTLIRLLDSNSGKQSYIVPASIDVSLFNEVYIWCEKYSVGLGVAPLN